MPSQQLPALAATIKRKLNEGHRCLYLKSRPMVAGIRSYLAAIGIDVESAIAKTRLVLSSESVTTEDGGFDVALMLDKLEGALDQALSEGYKGLWATGDMTWEFGAGKNFAKLMEYEYRLEELMHRRPELSGICQYHRDARPPDAARQALLTHRTIFINETLSRVAVIRRGTKQSIHPYRPIYCHVGGQKLTPVSAGMTVGTSAVYILLAHRVQTDQLVANRYDLLKLQNSIFSMLGKFVPAADIQRAADEARVPELYTVAAPQSSPAPAKPPTK